MKASIKNIQMTTLFSIKQDMKNNYLGIICDEKDENDDDYLENGLVIGLDTLNKTLTDIDYAELAFSINNDYELTVELGDRIFTSDAFTWQEITKVIDIKRLD